MLLFKYKLLYIISLLLLIIITSTTHLEKKIWCESSLAERKMKDKRKKEDRRRIESLSHYKKWEWP